MLYILLMIILLLPVLSGMGAVFKSVFGFFSGGMALQILAGIIFVTISWTLFAFIFPLNIYVEVTTLLIGIAAFFYYKIYLGFWDFLCKNKILFPAISAVIIFSGSYYPYILDHFGYFVPTVKWLSEVGLVKGISNLDLLLGQMSLWHVFQAGFSNFTDPFLRLNTFLLIVYLIYIIEKKSWIHLAFLPVLFLFSQSPSADLPVIVFSMIILNEVFNSNKNVALLLAFSVFVFAVKPTVIWLPVFVFFYGLCIEKRNFRFVLSGVFVLSLFIFKNMWTFGFPIFPVQFLDFGFSWKPNTEILQNSSEMAIMKTYDLQYSYAQIQQFSSFEYIKNWLLLDGVKSIIHIFFIISIIVFFIYSVCKKSKLVTLLFISVLIKSIVVLLFSAQYRFFFDVFFVIFFVLFYRSISKQFSLALFTSLSIFFIGFLSFPDSVRTYLPSFKLGNFLMGFQGKQLITPSHYELDKYKTHQIGNLKFNVVDGYIFSFDTPLPAISPQFIQEDIDAGIFPQLKTEKCKDGFIWRKISAEEKEKLKRILHDFQQ